MEKIKDMVAQMPQETLEVDAIFDEATPHHTSKEEHLEDITAGFGDMPVFEPVSKIKEDTKRSLNDKLKSGGLTIGLNDKLAFIKHLFDGKSQDYERVLSQINTSNSFKEASELFLERNVLISSFIVL